MMSYCKWLFPAVGFISQSFTKINRLPNVEQTYIGSLWPKFLKWFRLVAYVDNSVRKLILQMQLSTLFLSGTTRSIDFVFGT